MKPQILSREVISNPSESFQCLNSEMMNKSCALTTTKSTTISPGLVSHQPTWFTKRNKTALFELSNHRKPKDYWATVPLFGLPPKSHLSIKNSPRIPPWWSATKWHLSQKPPTTLGSAGFFGRKWLKKGDTGWCVLTCINHIHSGFLCDVSLKILHDLICRLKTQLSAWTTRGCHPNPGPRSRVGSICVELPSCCLPGGPQKVLGADHRDSSSRKAAWKFHSRVETEWFKAAILNRILKKNNAVDVVKWAIALIWAENQTAQSKSPWCYCPCVVEQSSW